MMARLPSRSPMDCWSELCNSWPRPHATEGIGMADWKKDIGAMTLMVPDLDSAKTFYEQAFGLGARDLGDEVMFRFGNMAVFLHEAAHTEPPTEVLEKGLEGAGQFAIIVEDVDAVSVELVEHGVELLSGPQDRPWGMRTVTFADPAGHIWEIAQEIPQGSTS
jgi:catechol 2,3-dioxygenase-like lactoylglutathione lyase family enzyme